MASVTSVLALQDRMSRTLNNIENAARSAEQAFENINRRINSMDTSMDRTTRSSNSFFKSLLSFNILSNIFSMISGQVGTAISRLDTLNGYTSVMSNLGVNSDKASESLNRLNEGLQGLPTTLQDGVLAVERFTSANNNIEASTEMFLALNNAILAGGAPMAIQQTALEQLSQAYTKGKPDMMEWRSAMTAMPAQLSQVAKVMGFVNADELGASLRNGETSMNDFMITLVKMSNESVDGFKSFEEQAINTTGGIQTSIANMKSAITRGLESIMRTINNSLIDAGFENGIGDVISRIGKTIEGALKSIGNAFGFILKIVTPVFKFIVDNFNVVIPIIGGIITALLIYKGVQTALNIATWAGGIATSYYAFVSSVLGAKQMLATGATLAQTAAQWGLNAALLACPITWIIIGIMALIAIISAVIIWIAKAKGESVSAIGVVAGTILMVGAEILNFIIGILNGIITIIDGVINTLIGIVEWGLNIMLGGFDNFGSMVANIMGKIISFVIDIAKAVTSVWDAIFGTNASGWLDDRQKEINSWGKNSKAITLGRVDHTMDRINPADAYNTGYNWGSNLFGGKASEKAQGEPIDYNSIMNGLKDVTGTDSTGGKAVKTTTEDKLLSDEDIQLLLDLATRDYKLNYQQVTPQITMTFGDIRENADVDVIADQLAERLQEIVDGNLEVQTV